MTTFEIIEALEQEWSREGGFLGLLRDGKFSDEGLDRFLNLLDGIDFSDKELIELRLVSLTWYIPSFMGWQRERLLKNGIETSKLNSAITEVENRLETILGVP